ncbi:MAG TPA: DUF1501 domain-containing protein [Planctomycetaceae bacterium]|nr:DUF1501 domain-containing protein [Planctomycetaceae bacterium]
MNCCKLTTIMLSLLDLPDNCPNLRFPRREWLRIGGTSLAGLSLAQRAGAGPATSARTAIDPGATFGRAKSVIVVFLSGGPPQHETWDPKPDAPAEVRGGFGTIATATPGLSVGELMPLTAQLTGQIAVLRAMVTNDNAHSSSGYQMMTGVPHVPLNLENAISKAPNLAPHWGAINRYVRPPDANPFPAAITLPNRIANTGEIVWPGQIGGALGPKYDPWLLTCDPSAPDFTIPDLSLPAELPALRFERRLSLLEQLSGHVDRLRDSAAIAGFNRQTQQALDLLGGDRARQAFDLSRESAAMRDRYGRTRWAQSLLLSRRLVEAGVPFVQVNWCRVDGEPNGGSWDTHDRHNDLLQRYLMPWMDRAYSALLTDLSERGLLDETLVVWTGEFGHTPRFNANAGRDHWGQCFSIALAGAGIRGGVVHGKSDEHAAHPVSGRVEPRDLLATMYHLLGHSPDTELHDTEGRPFPLSRGRVIEEIL